MLVKNPVSLFTYLFQLSFLFAFYSFFLGGRRIYLKVIYPFQMLYFLFVFFSFFLCFLFSSSFPHFAGYYGVPLLSFIFYPISLSTTGSPFYYSLLPFPTLLCDSFN